jgi:hypothetical protein
VIWGSLSARCLLPAKKSSGRREKETEEGEPSRRDAQNNKFNLELCPPSLLSPSLTAHPEPLPTLDDLQAYIEERGLLVPFDVTLASLCSDSDLATVLATPIPVDDTLDFWDIRTVKSWGERDDSDGKGKWDKWELTPQDVELLKRQKAALTTVRDDKRLDENRE